VNNNELHQKIRKKRMGMTRLNKPVNKILSNLIIIFPWFKISYQSGIAPLVSEILYGRVSGTQYGDFDMMNNSSTCPLTAFAKPPGYQLCMILLAKAVPVDLVGPRNQFS
jgi:hypothetical protein